MTKEEYKKLKGKWENEFGGANLANFMNLAIELLFDIKELLEDKSEVKRIVRPPKQIQG